MSHSTSSQHPPKLKLIHGDGAHLSRVLEMGKILRSILDGPNAISRVREMHSTSLHRLVATLGREECQDLIALAAPDQVRDLLDLSLWEKDQFIFYEALEWA